MLFSASKFFFISLNTGKDKTAITMTITDNISLSIHISETTLIASKLKYANLPIGYKIKLSYSFYK